MIRHVLGAALLLGPGLLALRAADPPPKQVQPPRIPFAHDSAVGTVAFAPDGVHIVSGAEDSIIRVWNRATGTEVRRLTGHRGRVSSLSFSPDGKLLASGSGDQTVGIWDYASGKLLHRCQGHDGWVRSVQFSPDGKTIASGSYDESVRLWEPLTGTQLHCFEGHTAPVTAVSFAPDGKSLASGDHNNIGRIWSVATGKEERKLPKVNRGEMLGVAFCGGGRLVATGSANGNLLLWNAESCEIVQSLEFEHTVLALTASPDGKLLLASSNDGELFVYETASRLRVLTFAGYQGGWNPEHFYPTTGVRTAIHAVAFSPDGAWLAAGDKDGRIRLWRFADLVHGDDKPRKLGPEDLDQVWIDLASPEPLVGCRAMVRLATAPALALPYLEKRLSPTPRLDDAKVRKLMTELDHDDFAVRERATEELEKYSEALRPLLRKALRERKLSAEAATRVRRLLERLDGTELAPERLREARVLQSLEWMATPAAQTQLALLAKGQPGSPLAEEAAQALARLSRRARP